MILYPFRKVPAIVLISMAYGYFALIFALGNRYQINPDGVAYLRLAKYLSEGHYLYSISNYWSPLIIWCFAPFLFLGVDGLITARVVIAVWGLLFLWGTWLLSNRFDLSYPFKSLAGLIAALTIAKWTSAIITPDILIAACLAFYFYLVTDADLVKGKQKAFLCGMAAGAAYLAKAYALPFFLIHFPVTIFIRRLTSGRNSRFPLGKMVKTLCFGMMGFSLLAAPWIGVMSVKYSTLTISAAGHKPEPYAIHSWEAPSDLAYKHWSPFQSFENFKHQFKVCLKNAAAIALYFGILGGPVLVLLPFLVLTGASFIVCRGSDERLSPLREMYTKVYTLGII